MLIQIYSDGSSHSKGNLPGGWAYVVVQDGQVIKAGKGNDPKTTNNIMELTGMLRGMESVEYLKDQYPDATFELISDSQYALGIANGTYYPSKNLDLCHKVIVMANFLKAKTKWVRGHSGDVFNERCDSLAKSAKLELVEHT
jgi:ribonuclease HI